MKDEGHITGRYRKPEERLKKRIPMQHRFAVNEFLYNGVLLAEQLQGVKLLYRLHEKEWNGNPLRVPVQTDAGYTIENN